MDTRIIKDGMRLRSVYRPMVVSACLVVSGCLLNSVRQIHHRTTPTAGQAIVVVGIGISTPGPYPAFSPSLDEYSPRDKKITGNCFHYNHIEASVPASLKEVHYFVFLVPAGVYVYSAFNIPMSSQPAAFNAPSKAIVYVGDYILVGEHAVELRNSLAAARAAVDPMIPARWTLEQADPVPSVEHGTAFLCTP